MRHSVMWDFFLTLRGQDWALLSGGVGTQLDVQGYWFPLAATLMALEIREPPPGLLPLPQPRAEGAGPNVWIMTLNGADEEDDGVAPIWIPLGLIATRLVPHSPRPIATVLHVWLAYCVLPICAQHGGPATWEGLDRLLNPAGPAGI